LTVTIVAVTDQWTLTSVQSRSRFYELCLKLPVWHMRKSEVNSCRENCAVSLCCLSWKWKFSFVGKI